MLVKAKETIWLEGLPPHNWRNIPIALTDPDFGEQTAQACENAWLRQLEKCKAQLPQTATAEVMSTLEVLRHDAAHPA